MSNDMKGVELTGPPSVAVDSQPPVSAQSYLTLVKHTLSLQAGASVKQEQEQSPPADSAAQRSSPPVVRPPSLQLPAAPSADDDKQMEDEDADMSAADGIVAGDSVQALAALADGQTLAGANRKRPRKMLKAAAATAPSPNPAAEPGFACLSLVVADVACSSPRAHSPKSAKNKKRKSCNCKNSRCLKLYCECFASGNYCDNCNCKVHRLLLTVLYVLGCGC